MRRRISSLLLSWLIVGSLGSATAQPASPPTLVVVVVVDQMRADYVERFHHQWTSGLRRLVDKGAWFRQAAYPYFQTNTCVGHATIATGSLPETHGIIGNNWYDRTEGRLRACADDVPTLGDELYAQGATEARVVSLSMKPRVAVMLAGYRANAVVWQQDRTWVTSTAYSDATIPFVARFLEANPIERDHGAVWARTLPNEAYLFESNTPTSRPLEGWTGRSHIPSSAGAVRPTCCSGSSGRRVRFRTTTSAGWRPRRSTRYSLASVGRRIISRSASRPSIGPDTISVRAATRYRML